MQCKNNAPSLVSLALLLQLATEKFLQQNKKLSHSCYHNLAKEIAETKCIEIYVWILLMSGNLFLADEELNRINLIYFESYWNYSKLIRR